MDASREHLTYLVECTKGMSVAELKAWYRSNFHCSVKLSECGNLFSVKYHMIKTDFTKLGSLATRGTVFEVENGVFNGNVACLPFYKFFNAHEPECFTPSPHYKVREVQEKKDGSLIKVFFFPKRSEWIVATNYTPRASPEFTALFERAIGKKVQDLGAILDEDKTYLFELCTPENKIVVEYATYSATLLMTRCRKTLREIPNPAPTEGFSVVGIIENFSEDDRDYEGVVVVYEGGNRVKMKTNWYKAGHSDFSRRFDGDSWKHVLGAVHGGTYDDISNLVSPELQGRATRYIANTRTFEEDIGGKLRAIGLDGLHKHDDKAKVVECLRDGTLENTCAHPRWLKGVVVSILMGKQTLWEVLSKNENLQDWIDANP